MNPEALADEITDLFRYGDAWLLLMSDGRAEGGEGVMGLHLVANCLNEHFEEEAMPTRPWRRPGGQAGRQAKVSKALKRLARETGAWFVLCYQLEDSGEWCMAWSDGLDPEEAYREVVDYVKCGMNLWT